MTIGSILLGLALLIIVGLYLGQPFLGHTRARQRPLTPYEKLLTQKEALLTEINDLDFDHNTGKVPTEVYQTQRAELVASAATVLKQIDALEQQQPHLAPATAERDIAAEIEAAINRARQPETPTVTVNGKGGYCSQCGAPFDSTDKFCTKCGHRVAASNR